MIGHFYELPIPFRILVEKEEELNRNLELPVCDLKKSIAQNIYLIITSEFKEHRFDESYGCELWDMDFELIANENMWLDRIRKSILKSVVTHEKRLYDINVDLDISQDEQITTLKNTRSVKKRLSIYVTGTIRETGESFPFNTNIYLSPLSLE